MHGEHPHSQQVGITQMVDEAADVAKKSCIDAVCVTYLYNKTYFRVIIPAFRCCLCSPRTGNFDVNYGLIAVWILSLSDVDYPSNTLTAGFAFLVHLSIP